MMEPGAIYSVRVTRVRCDYFNTGLKCVMAKCKNRVTEGLAGAGLFKGDSACKCPNADGYMFFVCRACVSAAEAPLMDSCKVGAQQKFIIDWEYWNQ